MLRFNFFLLLLPATNNTVNVIFDTSEEDSLAIALYTQFMLVCFTYDYTAPSLQLCVGHVI